MDNRGNQPLHHASSKNVPLLVAAGADPNARAKDGSTPVHALLEANTFDRNVLEQLIRLGADVNMPDGEGTTPLMLAAQHPEPIALDLVAAAGGRPNTKNYHGEGLLHVMQEQIFLRRIDTIELWSSQGLINVNDQNEAGETALFLSAVRGEEGMANILLEHGADLRIQDTCGMSPLHAVVGCFPVDRQLKDEKTLWTAKLSMLKRFLQAGLDPSRVDQAGNTPLMELAKAAYYNPDWGMGEEENNRHLEAIHMLARAGTPLSKQNTAGQTCLHLSAANIERLCRFSKLRRDYVGKNSPLQAFVKLGLDVNLKDRNGNTPLHAAAGVNRSTGRLAEYHVSTLLAAGSDPGSINNEMKTALHIAAESGQCAAVDILLGFMWSNKARDQQDSFGNTALHYAVRSGKFATVRSLLDACANSSLRNKDRETPLEVAMRYSGDEYCGLSLKSHHSYEIILALQQEETRRSVDHDSDETRSQESTLQHTRTKSVEPLALNQEGKLDVKDVEGRSSAAVALLKASLFRFVKKYGVAKTIMLEAIDGDQHMEEVGRVLCEVVRRWDRKGLDLMMGVWPDLLLKRFNKACLSMASPENGPALHIMALSGWDQMIERFIRPETIDTRGDLNQTLLHYAVLRDCNNLAMLKLLISYGIDVNAKASNQNLPPSCAEVDVGATALHYLARSEYEWQVEGLSFLYQMGGDVNLVDDREETCLQLAISSGGYYKHEMVKTLLEIGADVRTPNGGTVLWTAVESGDIELVRVLLDHGLEIEDGPQNPLYAAIRLQNIEMVKILIGKGAKVDSKPSSCTPEYNNSDLKYESYSYTSILAEALWEIKIKTRADAEMVRDIFNLLLQHGADINETACHQVSLIHWLAYNNGFLDLIIKAGADIERLDSKGQTPLIVACGRPNRVEAQLTGCPHPALSLLAAGADAKVTDESGKNSLHHFLARSSGYGLGLEDGAKIVKALLEAGCPPSTPDNDGWTPLHIALETGRFSLAVMLKSAGADIMVADPMGDNALHHVGRWISRYPFRLPEISLSDPKPFMLRFLNAGIDINGINSEGETPIFRAVEADFTQSHLQLYVDCGANIKARNAKGQGLLHAVAWGFRGGVQRSEVYGIDWFDLSKYERQVLEGADGNVEAAKFKLLMDAGLDPHMQDNLHRTPLDVAAASGLSAILKLFAE